jgi:hypothetical protein
MGAIMASQFGGHQPQPGAQLGAAAREAFKTSFMNGFQDALMVAALIAFAGAIVAFVLVRPHELEESTERRDAPELAA